MSELTLISDFSLDTTSLSNIYIDEYMSYNNESQIKIYLYLLRNLTKGTPVSVITIADAFNYSVMDVERALIYMEKQGLMGLKVENGNIVGLRLLPLKKKRVDASIDGVRLTDNFRLINKMDSDKIESNIIDSKEDNKNTKKEIVKPEYSALELSEFTQNEDIQELMFVVQAYTKKPVTQGDIKSLMFINKELKFSSDLIDYLVEHCVENGKKSFRYIEKVAISWYEEGVTSVSEAKEISSNIPKEVYEVFDAFNIKAGARKPSFKETSFVRKWIRDFGYDMSVIKKACEITIDNTHSVSFEYADAVLTDWFKNGAKNLSDVLKLLSNKKGSQGSGSGAKKPAKAGGFSGRNYDFEQLEKELLSK